MDGNAFWSMSGSFVRPASMLARRTYERSGGRRGKGLVSADRLGEREEECRPVDWMDLEPGICSRDSIRM